MRIVLHGGLHKSGTTTVQYEWRAAYRNGGRVRYPSHPGTRLPGHHGAVWPLMDAFTQQIPTDIVWARSLRRSLYDLGGLVREADGEGVEVLLLSTEELDRLRPSDVPSFQQVLAPHEVVTLHTVTRPVHRWCSGWQAT